MSIGVGIAIAGAFIGTALAFFFAPELSPWIFAAPTLTALFLSI